MGFSCFFSEFGLAGCAGVLRRLEKQLDHGLVRATFKILTANSDAQTKNSNGIETSLCPDRRIWGTKGKSAFRLLFFSFLFVRGTKGSGGW